MQSSSTTAPVRSATSCATASGIEAGRHHVLLDRDDGAQAVGVVHRW